jgi:hypothetical protein
MGNLEWQARKREFLKRRNSFIENKTIINYITKK